MLSGLRLVVIVLAIVGAAVGAEDFSEPRLKPEEILQRVNEYLANEKPSIQLKEYELTKLSFDYQDGRWWVLYECVSRAVPGCHFGVWVSNSVNPEFRYFAGK